MKFMETAKEKLSELKKLEELREFRNKVAFACELDLVSLEQVDTVRSTSFANKIDMIIYMRPESLTNQRYSLYLKEDTDEYVFARAIPNYHEPAVDPTYTYEVIVLPDDFDEYYDELEEHYDRGAPVLRERSDDRLSKALFVVGVLYLIIGAIGFMLAIEYAPEAAIIYVISMVGVALIFLALKRIIDLLTDIKYK